ncbi:MAG: phage integrase N-terminal SAM-like domain-containing protein [Candidatus Methylomirabilia bacterium]
MQKSNVRSLIEHRLNVLSQRGQPAAAISSPSEAPKPRLLDRVRQAMRARHLSPKTEEAYIGWIKRFIFFHEKRHPAEMGEAEIGLTQGVVRAKRPKRLPVVLTKEEAQRVLGCMQGGPWLMAILVYGERASSQTPPDCQTAARRRSQERARSCRFAQRSRT